MHIYEPEHDEYNFDWRVARLQDLPEFSMQQSQHNILQLHCRPAK
jgi:hypothetical protein